MWNIKIKSKKNVYENFILLMNIVLICYYGNIKWWYFKGYYYMIIVNWIKFLNGLMVLLFEWLLFIGLIVCFYWVVIDWYINVIVIFVDVYV